MECRYRYVATCGRVAVRVHVTVYQTDSAMRETSRRLMCRGCAEHLSQNPEHTIHSMVLLDLRCHRTACRVANPTHQHTQSGEVYCGPCARRINEHNPGLVIRMTEEHLQNALESAPAVS